MLTGLQIRTARKLLKWAAWRALIDQAAASDMLPSDGGLRRIADLENAIAPVAALIEERRGQ